MKILGLGVLALLQHCALIDLCTIVGEVGTPSSCTAREEEGAQGLT